MLLSTSIICAFAALLSPFAFAGEIVLYTQPDCSRFETIFAADTTTNCRKAEQSILGPTVYAASTSRAIGKSCKFNLYTDAQCKNLAQAITSSGPLKKCLPITKGMQSYQITCGKAVQASIARPRPESLTINTYFQPQVPYRNKPSGHTNIIAGLAYYGASISQKPFETPSSVGTKLASEFFSKVPAGAQNFTALALYEAIVYQIDFSASPRGNFTALSAARRIGKSAFASLMADTVVQLQIRPSEYYQYVVYDDPETIGTLSMSYTLI